MKVKKERAGLLPALSLLPAVPVTGIISAAYCAYTAQYAAGNHYNRNKHRKGKGVKIIVDYIVYVGGAGHYTYTAGGNENQYKAGKQCGHTYAARFAGQAVYF